MVVGKQEAVDTATGWWFTWFWDCAGEAEGLVGWESEIKRTAGNSPLCLNFPVQPIQIRIGKK